MTDAYKFEYDGIEVQFHRGTVRSGIEARQIMQKLLFAHGFYDGNIAPDDIYRLMDEYASCAARSKTEAEWWGHSNMSEEDLKRRFEIFLDEDEQLYVELRSANIATKQPQKKAAVTST
jgi:hypothetical protein